MHDLFIFFDSPACFNCREIWQTLEQVIAVTNETKDLVFAYVDLGKNELQVIADVY
jgi:hypothetical protein